MSQGNSSLAYELADLTRVVSLRAHADNPWVLERLALWSSYSKTPITTIVVDMGSEPEFQTQVKGICDASGFEHLYLADSGTYSQAVGRNAAIALVKTPLVFFNDADCVGAPDLFKRLVDQANAMAFADHWDRIINLPVYHLTKDLTKSISDSNDLESRNERLAHAMARAPHTASGDVVDYIDPFSNFFLCRKDFFEYVGGYNEEFRGHGSEDFEFLIRFAHYGNCYPLPVDVLTDIYSPVRDSFFARDKEYRGFRRLGEVMAFDTEIAGLRIAHLHHPRGATDSSWYRDRDVRRERFEEQLRPFLSDPASRLSYDWCSRLKAAVVVGVRSDQDCQRALALRKEGYRLRSSLAANYNAKNKQEALVAFQEDRADPTLIAAVQRAKEAGCEVVWLSRLGEEHSKSTELAPNSYLAGRLGLGLKGARVETTSRPQEDEGLSDASVRLKKRIAKLTRDPHRFLRDSRFALLRVAAKAFPPRD